MMANHDLAIETLLNSGLRHRKLDEILASNCVMDWFGRTFIGQRRVIDFYQNSNATHEHSMPKIKSTESFEDRPYHQLTSREQPLENLKNSPEMMTGDEQWFDCDTHSPINLKEGQRTPAYKASPPQCPPAPSRFALSFVDSSDDELEISEHNLNESGIRPLDSSIQFSDKKVKSPNSKRLRREEQPETTIIDPNPSESKFSDLFYLEASGNVTINRQPSASDEVEKRDCKMLISYRIHKEDPSVVQIALIVYKPDSQNVKSRRNLMSEFGEKPSELVTGSSVNGKQTTPRCRTVVKDRKKFEESTANGIASAPAGAKYSRAIKRPLIIKHPARI